VKVELEVPAAVLIGTAPFLRALEAAEYAWAHNKMTLVHGWPGTGKTTAARAIVAQHPERACLITLDYAPNPTAVVNEALTALTGVAHHESGSRGRTKLLELLADDPKLLIFDELHLVESTRNIELIRALHQRLGLPIVLAGDHRVGSRLVGSPQIMRRIHRPCWMAPLETADIVAILPRFHNIYGDASAELISEIDARYGHGNLGNWSKFTVRAVDECARRGLATIDLALSKKIISEESTFAVHGHARSR
jgi:type II secretory pathway predicted ATPase ExeA